MATAEDPRTRQTETRCRVLGIDGDGWEHIYDKDRELVVVISRYGIDIQVDLSDIDKDLSDWMKHVAAKRGWDHEQWDGYRLSGSVWGGVA